MGKIEKQMQELNAYLKEATRISLAETEELLGVSESTARRMFARMEAQSRAIRIHGGLQLLPEAKPEYNYPSMEARRIPQKKRIGRAAVECIGDARTLFLDSGSTMYQFSLCLAEWLRAGRKDMVSVFTNSLKNLQALSGLVNIQFIGGKYREHRQDCCGFLAEGALQGLNFDLCFLGGDGCTVDQGISCTDMETARLGQIAVSRSQKKVVLLDSTKFQRGALVSYARLEELDMVLSDTELDPEIAKQIRAKGPDVRLV